MPRSLQLAIIVARKAHAAADLIAPRDDINSPYFVSADIYAGYVEEELRKKYNTSDFSIRTPKNQPNTPDFYGMSAIIPDQNMAVISYSVAKSFCLKRFTMIKELSHLLTGEFNSENGADCKLTAARMSRWGFPKRHEEIDAEMFGLCIAVEISMPWKLRGNLSELFSESCNCFKAAESARVPESMVYLMFEQGYGEISAEINMDISI